MTLLHGFALPCRVRHTRRRGSIALRVSQDEIRILAPQGTPLHAIEALLLQRRDWLDAAVRAQQVSLRRPPLEPGGELLLAGIGYRLELITSAQPAVCLANAQIRVSLPDPSDLAACRQLLGEYLQRRAEAEWPDRLAAWSRRCGLTPSGLKIRPYKSRWGACTARGLISLNTLLMMAPPAVLDYVMVHELCHLRHLNHSAAYWQLVARWCPDHAERRRWLRLHAGRLQLG